ncbi:hypothetical protein EV426DRAFT_45528, partial [Tirmania nivea]
VHRSSKVASPYPRQRYLPKHCRSLLQPRSSNLFFLLFHILLVRVMPVRRSQSQNSLHRFHIATPHSSPGHSLPYADPSASGVPPMPPASSPPRLALWPSPGLTDLPTDWSAAVNIIRKHFESCESREQTLVLSVVNKCVANDLCNNYLSPSHFRYTLFLETNPPTVIIRPMPKAPHSFAENYFSNLVNEMQMAGVLTTAEANSRIRTTVDVQLPSRQWIPVLGEFGPCDIKVADAAFGPTWGRPFPFIIVEVGFSQPYDHPKVGLLQDARHWLEQSEGEVKCVILVCIDENKKLIRRPTGGETDIGDNQDQEMKGGSEECQGEGMEDGQDFEIGEYESEESDADVSVSAQSTDSSGSSAKVYWAHFKRFTASHNLVAEHAGPLTAFLEVWRYDKRQKQMIQSGSRIILLPTPSLPTITLTRRDFGFRPTEENNEYHMNLGELANLLKGPARKMLAYQRYVYLQAEGTEETG